MWKLFRKLWFAFISFLYALLGMEYKPSEEVVKEDVQEKQETQDDTQDKHDKQEETPAADVEKTEASLKED